MEQEDLVAVAASPGQVLNQVVHNQVVHSSNGAHSNLIHNLLHNPSMHHSHGALNQEVLVLLVLVWVLVVSGALLLHHIMLKTC